MKKLLLAALGIFLMTAILDSCKDNSSSLLMPMKTSPPGGASANPAIAYTKYNINGQHAVCVMDTDAKNQTMVWSYGINSGVDENGWSPGGNSLLLSSSVSGIDSLNAIDISVSGGVPVASNYRSILTHDNNTDTTTMTTSRWSSTAAVNKIAYAISPRRTSATGHPYSTTLASINLVSASGGLATTLHTFGNGGGTQVYSIFWNTDDSKIAAILDSANVWQSIVILDPSTGAVTDSIPLSGVTWRINDWSKGTTLNKLLLQNNYIYYLSPSTGSTPTTNNVATDGSSTFSPNNSGVMYTITTFNPTTKHQTSSSTVSLLKDVTQTGTTSTIVSNFNTAQIQYGISNLNWKR